MEARARRFMGLVAESIGHATNPNFCQAAWKPRVQYLAESLRAGRPSGQPVWRPALRFPAAIERCALAVRVVFKRGLVGDGEGGTVKATRRRLLKVSLSASPFPARRR